jgi:hypothetical protein
MAPLLSIVIPVRDEEASIAPLAAEIAAALGERPHEVLFVDDGSRDRSFAEIKAAHLRDGRVRGLRLRSASGKSAAYMAGFRAARGGIIATLDGDLQDDPADLVLLLARLEDGADLVVGWKAAGKNSAAGFILSRAANALLRIVSRPKLHDMNCPVRVMRREVAEALELGADLHRYIPLIAHARGFRVAEHPVQNRPRRHGHSKYGGGKYLSSAIAYLGVQLDLRFGRRPMVLFGGVGLLMLVAGLSIDLYYAGVYVLGGRSIDDHFPTVMLGVVLILIGTQFLSLGLLAEILLRRFAALDGARAEIAESV